MKQSGIIKNQAGSRAWFALFAALASAIVLLAPSQALAQTETAIIPDVWQGGVFRAKPDLTGLKRLRFVTDSDYPPFHYYDEEGVLTGLNVDLANSLLPPSRTYYLPSRSREAITNKLKKRLCS